MTWFLTVLVAIPLGMLVSWLLGRAFDRLTFGTWQKLIDLDKKYGSRS